MVRIKRRYVVAKVVGERSSSTFAEHDIMNEISGQVAQSYGDYGVGCLKRSFSIKKYSHFSGYIIIQTRKGVHEMVMSSLPLISKVGDTNCQMNMVHLSGTLRSSLKHVKQDHIMNLRANIAKKIALDAQKKAKSLGMQQ